MIRMPHRLTAIAVAAGTLLLTAAVAQAFTIEDYSSSGSGASARYSDGNTVSPNPTAPRFGAAGPDGPTVGANPTLRFGAPQGSFNQRYDSNRFFDPMNQNPR